MQLWSGKGTNLRVDDVCGLRPWFFLEQGFPSALLELWPIEYSAESEESQLSNHISDHMIYRDALRLALCGYLTKKFSETVLKRLFYWDPSLVIKWVHEYVFEVEDFRLIIQRFNPESLRKWTETSNPMTGVIAFEWREVQLLCARGT